MSKLEAAFDHYFALLGVDLPTPTAEYAFALPARRWRFDRAWPKQRVAVEIDGGTFAPGGGRHNTDRDREKLNAAAARGWRVLRFSGQQLRSDPAGCIETLRAALAWSSASTTAEPRQFGRSTA